MQSRKTERLLYSLRRYLFHPMSLFLVWIPIALFMPRELQGQQLHTYLDRDSVEVGEPFHLILVLQRQDGDEVMTWPNPESLASDELHLVSNEHFRPLDTRDSLRFRFQYFGLRDTTLSSLSIDLLTESGDTLRLSSPELPVRFRSVTQEEDEFRPMKPLYEFARTLWPWLLLAILFIILIYWFYRWRRTTEEDAPGPVASPRPFTDPLRELEQAIQQATSEPPSEVIHNPTPSTIRLGDGVRSYLERVHDLPALERTSREILDEWRRQAGNQEIHRALVELFRLADRIKFARYTPTVDEIQQLRQAALRFLQIIREEDRHRIQSMRESYEGRPGRRDSLPEESPGFGEEEHK